MHKPYLLSFCALFLLYTTFCLFGFFILGLLKKLSPKALLQIICL